MQHIGIGDDDVPGKAHSVAGIDRCIAVIGKGLDLFPHVADELVEFGVLVGSKCLGWKEIQRTGTAAAQNGFEHKANYSNRFCRKL